MTFKGKPVKVVITGDAIEAYDSLNKIVGEYNFLNYKTAGIISVPSGNLDLIRPGDIITIGN